LPQLTPRHYDIHTWTISEARKFLDVKYQLGWRVAMMTPQAGGRKIIFLFEKTASSNKPVDSNGATTPFLGSHYGVTGSMR